MRTPLVAANWKMYKTVAEAEAFFREFGPLVTDMDDVEIVVAPPFLSVQAAAGAVRGTPRRHRGPGPLLGARRARSRAR